MTSVERVIEYSHLIAEPDVDKSTELPETWPSNGRITAHGACYSYHETLPYVLKNVCFEIRPKEKVHLWESWDPVSYNCSDAVLENFQKSWGSKFPHLRRFPVSLKLKALSYSAQNRESFWSVFSPNTGKYRPEKLRIWTLFAQWLFYIVEIVFVLITKYIR